MPTLQLVGITPSLLTSVRKIWLCQLCLNKEGTKPGSHTEGQVVQLMLGQSMLT